MAPGRKRKRQCELGKSCPYQDEYQHDLEFSHDLPAPPPKDAAKAFQGSGRALGGEPPKDAVKAFQGSGRALGGEPPMTRPTRATSKLTKAATTKAAATKATKAAAAKVAPPKTTKAAAAKLPPPKTTSVTSPIEILDSDEDDDEVEIVEKPPTTKKVPKKRRKASSDDDDVEIVSSTKKKKTKRRPAVKEGEDDEVEFIAVKTSWKVPTRKARVHLPRPPPAVFSSVEEEQPVLRLKRPSYDADRLITEEQDADYEASLAADKAKEKKRKDDEEERLAALELERGLEASRKSAEDLAQKLFLQKKERLERNARTLGDDVVKVRVRFPDGSAKIHTFNASGTLSQLFDFVDVHGPDKNLSTNLDIVDTATRHRLRKDTHKSFADLGLEGPLSLLVLDEEA